MRWIVLIIALSGCYQSPNPELSRLDVKLNDDGPPIIGYQFNRKSNAAIASDVRLGNQQQEGYNIKESSLDPF